jgi:hypothetical protein
MARLQVDYRDSCNELNKLYDLQAHTTPLPPRYRKLVAEIILLRVFSLMEDIFCSVACKITCGAPYCDGSQSNLLVRSSSSGDAIQKMINYGRAKPRWPLYWSRANQIKKNLRYMIAANDHYMLAIDHHGQLIDEIRRIRNRIAHNNQRSRGEYRHVVGRYYGARLNNVTPGTLLLSTRRTPVLIEEYLVKCRILIRHLVKA